METSITVSKAVIDDQGLRAELIEEARNRIIGMGLATADQLTVEPTITVSPQSTLGDDITRFVNVTFRWEPSEPS